MGWGGKVQSCLCGSPGDPAAILKGSALTAWLGRVRNAEVKGLPPSPRLSLLPPQTQGSPSPAQSKPRALSPLQAAERVLAPHNPMPPRRLRAAPRVPGWLFPGEGSSSRGIHHFPATPCPSSPSPVAPPFSCSLNQLSQARRSPLSSRAGRQLPLHQIFPEHREGTRGHRALPHGALAAPLMHQDGCQGAQLLPHLVLDANHPGLSSESPDGWGTRRGRWLGDRVRGAPCAQGVPAAVGKGQGGSYLSARLG